MSPRTGRPKSDNPKSERITVRLDSEYTEILDDYCTKKQINRAEGIRQGIKMLKEKE